MDAAALQKTRFNAARTIVVLMFLKGEIEKSNQSPREEFDQRQNLHNMYVTSVKNTK